MHITYVLLSPTFGMHQYTADLANRAADSRFKIQDSRFKIQDSRWETSSPVVQKMEDGLRATVVTTTAFPRDRYSPAVQIQTPINGRTTGFSREGLDLAAYRHLQSVIFNLQSPIYHFTGVHAWNLPLVHALRRRGATVIHTLHDLDPHHGVRFPALIRLWNRLIVASGAHILVHGRRYRDRLLAQGLPPSRVTCAPLLHGFWGHEAEPQAAAGAHTPILPAQPRHVIFFGRLEWYKGIDTLLAAWAVLSEGHTGVNQAWPQRLILAGAVAHGLALPALPAGVELRDRRIPDAEGIELFRQAALLVLPYRDATQSALIATAYRFGVPVIVTRTGALPEAVIEGETGWVVPPNDPAALAAALSDALSDLDRLGAFGLAGQAWFVRQRQFEEETLSTLYLAKTMPGYKPQSTK